MGEQRERSKGLHGNSRGKGASGLLILSQNTCPPIQCACLVRNHSAILYLLKISRQVALLFSATSGAHLVLGELCAYSIQVLRQTQLALRGFLRTSWGRSVLTIAEQDGCGIFKCPNIDFLVKSWQFHGPSRLGSHHFLGCISPCHHVPQYTATYSQLPHYFI